MSLKRTTETKLTEQLDDKRPTLDNAAQTSRSARNYIGIRPECSKRQRSIVFEERDQTKAVAVSSSDKPTASQLTIGKCHQSSPVRQAEKQLPSLPIIDVDGPMEVISIGKEGHLQDERQSSEGNSNIYSQRASNTATAAITPPQPAITVGQPSHSDHHDHQKHSQGKENFHSNFQPITTEARSIRESNIIQTPRTDRISGNEPYASHHLPSSLKMSARLNSQMKDKTSLIPMYEPVDTRIRLANRERLMAIAAQNSSNIMDQRKPSPPGRQEPTVSQNSSMEISHFRINIGKFYDMNALEPKVVLERIDSDASAVQHTPSLPYQHPSFVRRRNSPSLEPCQQQPMDVPDAFQQPSGLHNSAQRSLGELLMHKASNEQVLPNLAGSEPNAGAPQSYQNNPGDFHHEQRQELRRTRTEGVNPAQPTRSGIEINIPACHLISTNVASQTVQSSNSSQIQPPQYHRDMQPHPSQTQVFIPTNANNDGRLPTVQGVTKTSLSRVQPSIPDSIRQSLTDTYTDYLLHLQQSEARLQGKPIDHDPGFKVPVQNILPVAAGEVSSLERPLSSSQQYGRELFRSDIDNVGQHSLPQPIHQLPEMAMKRVHCESNIANSSDVQSSLRSANRVLHADKRMEVDPVYPDQGSSLDPEIAVDHGVIPELEPFTNNVDYAGTSGGQGSALVNNQPHARIVMEQQMLDHFSTMLTQIKSCLYNSSEMYNNLRSSILETADTYKKLLELAQSFNTLRAAKSAASISSTVSSRILPFNEEKQPTAPKRANSSNHNQHRSRVDKEPPNKKRWKIVLPPEYDPNNTGWSLKYRKMVPELKELSPGRGIYVNSTKLMYAERVSGDCKTLASLVLEEVFCETALVVCSTLHETKSPNDCWIERPPLDPAALDALFSYITRYGLLHGWNVDTGEISKALDSKIYEIRVKHDILAEPYSP